MEKEVGSYASRELAGEEYIVEHSSFPWNIKAFLSRSETRSNYLGTLFSASGDDESFTLWQLNMDMRDSQNGIRIDLTRLKSQNASLVFVRFHWEIIDVDGNNVFPGSFHAFAYPGDKLSKEFVPDIRLLEDKRCIQANGDLRVSCEISVYGRAIDELISRSVKSNVPYRLCVLSEDMEKLLFAEPGADLYVTAADGMMHCHKSILSARSSVFAELIEMTESEENHLDLGELKADSLHAILMHVYCGSIDMYMKHTVPKELYSQAEKYGLLDLKQHLDLVDSNDLSRLRSIDVTWKLPYFNLLSRQPKVVLYCPEPNSSTFYDNRWCFKLEFDSSSDDVGISVIRKQDECSVHTIKFVVKIESCGKTAFERTSIFKFEVDGEQGMDAFMTKDELNKRLSFEDSLVLKCSLEVLHYTSHSPEPLIERNLSTVIDQFSIHTESSLVKLSEDLTRLYESGTFADRVANTKIGEISYHSFMADARFLTPEQDLRPMLENLNPTLIQTFFNFLYGGDILKNRASSLQWCGQRFCLRKVAQKFSDFIAFCVDAKE